MKRSMQLLPQISFSILLALSLKPRHGYEIIKQVEQDSLGRVSMGPGTLYGSVKLLLQQGFIEELIQDKNDRRRYYQLTARGRQKLDAEIEYYNNTVLIAQKRLKIDGLLRLGSV